MPPMQRRAALLLTLPAALVFLGVFVAPMAWFVLLSFWRVDFYEIARTPTLANWREVWARYLPSLMYTAGVAAVTALATTAGGFAFAFLARFRAGRWAEPLLFLVLVTLFGGYLMKIYAWKTILGNEGLLNTALLSAGLVSEPVTWLLYSPPAVVVTLLHFSLPFAILPIYASLRGVSDGEVEAARDLGARPGAILATVLVPRAQAGIVAAFSLVFLIVAGDYVTPLLVGGRQNMIGNLIAPQFGAAFNWPLGSAMSLAMLLVATAAILLFRALLAWAVRPGGAA